MDENLLAMLIQPQDPHILSAVLYGCRQVCICEGGCDEQQTQFCAHWAPFNRETLLLILEKGTRIEKVTALYSLGHLGDDQDLALLATYLHSSDTWEQWASAEELWKRGKTEVMPVLQALVWDESLIDLWHHPEQDPDAFAFRSTLARRWAIAQFIWGESTDAIPFLLKTLHWCWNLERRFDEVLDRWYDLQEFVFSWEDLVVYGLGRFQVWDASLQDQLPAGRVRIAQVIWILGFLTSRSQ